MRITFLIPIAMSLLVMSCSKVRIKPSDNITSAERKVSNFNQVVVSGAIDADVTFSATEEKVVVETNSNLHTYIVTEVKAGKLYIRVKNNVQIKQNPTIRIHITAKSLNDIEVSGASTFLILNDLVSSSLNVELSGASEIYGFLNVDNCSLHLSGASVANLSGYTKSSTMKLTGASSIEGLGFAMGNLTINLSGASNAMLKVNNTIEVTASGASTLRYAGDANISYSDLSGASSIIKL